MISTKNNNQGYDAQKADVWACGVLLFVMLLGMFPFEHAEHPDPNSSDAHVEVRHSVCVCVCVCVCHWPCLPCWQAQPLLFCPRACVCVCVCSCDLHSQSCMPSCSFDCSI